MIDMTRTNNRYANMLGSALLRHGLVPSMHHAEPITGENLLLGVIKT
jgi:hypothetical protein